MFMAQAALPHLKEGASISTLDASMRIMHALIRQSGSSIINTHSVVSYKGSGGIVDYATTKGAL